MNSGDFVYVGTELDLFAKAENWKSYFTQFIRPYIAGPVLEVGAGMGASTRALWHPGVERWICLEPDAGLCRQLEAQCAAGQLPAGCEARAGSLQDLPADDRFRTILYIDVLEHIEDDQHEVQRAAEHLQPGGHLVVLAPAHNWLFSPFDQAVGHFRRYSRPALLELGLHGLRPVAARYLDSVGMLASMANRVLLRASTPSVTQIVFWDRFMVPCSRLLDPLLGYALGKTVVVIWQRQS